MEAVCATNQTYPERSYVVWSISGKKKKKTQGRKHAMLLVLQRAKTDHFHIFPAPACLSLCFGERRSWTTCRNPHGAGCLCLQSFWSFRIYFSTVYKDNWKRLACKSETVYRGFWCTQLKVHMEQKNITVGVLQGADRQAYVSSSALLLRQCLMLTLTIGIKENDYTPSSPRAFGSSSKWQVR